MFFFSKAINSYFVILKYGYKITENFGKKEVFDYLPLDNSKIKMPVSGLNTLSIFRK